MNTDLLAQELTRDEGIRSKPYLDTVGKSTIGVGRNLTDVGLSDDEILMLLKNDIDRVLDELDRVLPWFRSMSDNRQRCLANMSFNLGLPTLLQFKATLGAMQAGRYDDAAAGMMDSKWARQVGQRAVRLAQMMREG
jgi:lysozyme